jgi:transposase InsO family protein
MGFAAGRDRIARLRRQMGIRCRQKRKFKATTHSVHGLPVAENVLGQVFEPTRPNEIWTGDITYISTDEGWLYLAIVLDLFNREVIGWSLKPRITSDLLADALTMAWFRRRPAAGAMHHSGRGSQYASQAFQGKLKEFEYDLLHESQGKSLG